MSKDLMREQFDEFMMSQASHGIFMGGFTFEEEDAAWKIWQASREAVVVELPKDIVTMAGPVLYADDVRAAIEAQGLKVAP